MPETPADNWVELPEEFLSGKAGGGTNKKMTWWGWLLIGLVIGAILSGAGTYFWMTEINEKPGQEAQVRTNDSVKVILPTGTIAPTPVTEEKTLDRADIRLKVENGSGIAGKAAEIGVYLTGLGYQVTETGNSAGKINNTTVSLSPEKAGLLTTLLSDLKTEYPNATSGGTLTTDGTYDGIVILGRM